MNSKLKKSIIKSKYIWIHIRNKFLKYVGNFLLILAVIIFLLIFCTNIFHRLPIFSYLIKELNLPITLNINGEIDFYENGKLISDLPITVKIGGYEQSVYSGENFNLNFSAVNTQNIPVVIEYKSNNNDKQKVIYISYANGSYEYTLKRIFEYK